MAASNLYNSNGNMEHSVVCGMVSSERMGKKGSHIARLYGILKKTTGISRRKS